MCRSYPELEFCEDYNDFTDQEIEDGLPILITDLNGGLDLGTLEGVGQIEFTSKEVDLKLEIEIPYNNSKVY